MIIIKYVYILWTCKDFFIHRCAPKYIWRHLFLVANVRWNALTVNSVGGKLLLKVMHYNIALLPKEVTNYVT